MLGLGDVVKAMKEMVKKLDEMIGILNTMSDKLDILIKQNKEGR